MDCIQNCNHYLWRGKGICEQTGHKTSCICPDSFLNIDEFGRPSCVPHQAYMAVHVFVLILGLAVAGHSLYWIARWFRTCQAEQSAATSTALQDQGGRQGSLVSTPAGHRSSLSHNNSQKKYTATTEQQRGRSSSVSKLSLKKGTVCHFRGNAKRRLGFCRRFGLYLFLLLHGLLSATLNFLFIAIPGYNYTDTLLLLVIGSIFGMMGSNSVIALLMQNLPQMKSCDCPIVHGFQNILAKPKSFRIFQLVLAVGLHIPALVTYFFNPFVAVYLFILAFTACILFSSVACIFSLRKLLVLMQELNQANSSSASYTKTIQRTRKFLIFGIFTLFLGAPYFILLSSWHVLWETPLIFFTLAYGIMNLSWPHVALLMFPTRSTTTKVHNSLNETQ
mmetsp:Transcript_2079/g.2861  ORF Transcript_2079/g.2861 Transcript_2079/m.2861 type:complete len:391 (-) Transcript_2079:304-1476(-)